MEKLATTLTQMGHPISADTVRTELVKLGFSRQSNRKADEGSKHPDRNAQFEYINSKVIAAQAQQQPVISVDTKKKELVGNFKNGGTDYRPKGDPQRVNVHDFENKKLGKVVPYGVYDVTANTGFISVGITSDTAEFAVLVEHRRATSIGIAGQAWSSPAMTAGGAISFRCSTATSPDRPNPLCWEPRSRLRLIPSFRTMRILVFDSGLGGLTVFREVAKARPDADYVYVADDAFFPYGKHSEEVLVGRVVPLMAELIARHVPDIVVIACNTASTIVLPHLRAQFTVPFVGTVPAIKPACSASRSKRVSVLGTEATVKREYTRSLIRDFGQGCDVTLVGSAHLAGIAESALHGTPPDDADIAARACPLLRRRRRAAHRHHRARLHALPPGPRQLRAARALAGRLDRPRAGHRPPGHRSHRQGHGRRRPARPGRSSRRARAPRPRWPCALAKFGLRDAMEAAG